MRNRPFFDGGGAPAGMDGERHLYITVTRAPTERVGSTAEPATPASSAEQRRLSSWPSSEPLAFQPPLDRTGTTGTHLELNSERSAE